MKRENQLKYKKTLVRKSTQIKKDTNKSIIYRV